MLCNVVMSTVLYCTVSYRSYRMSLERFVHKDLDWFGRNLESWRCSGTRLLEILSDYRQNTKNSAKNLLQKSLLLCTETQHG